MNEMDVIARIPDAMTEEAFPYCPGCSHGTIHRLVAEVMELRRSFEWRGLGMVPYSALQIKKAYAEFDAEKRFEVPAIQASDVKGCECPRILRGVKKPTDCKLFGTVCTPENPMGSCMVSSEGACAAYWSYGRFRGPESQRDSAA